MKKKVTLLLAAILIIAALPGCRHNDPNIHSLNGNGSGNVTDVQIGEIIQFGGTNWLVLDICETTNHAKILRERVILNQPYHHTFEAVTWETSSSRAWLNYDFLNSFSEADRERIRETYVINNDNPWTWSSWGWHQDHTPGGNNIRDRIFLLSIEEVAEYFGGSELLELGREENNRDGSITGLYPWGIWENNEISNARIALNEAGSASWWWLRSPGYSGIHAAYVYGDGYVSLDGDYVSAESGGVRPALWLNLES